MAIAASMASPPSLNTRAPASVASGCGLVVIPDRSIASISSPPRGRKAGLVERTVGSIAVFVNARMSWIWLDPLTAADEACNAAPVLRQTSADRRRPGDPEAGAGMAGQGFERLLQDVRDDLHPYPALRPAIRDDEPLRPVADPVEDLDMMAQRVSIGFEHRPPQMADIVREGEAVDGAAGIGVMDRRLFAEEIGQDRHALGARRMRGRQTVEPAVRRDALGVRRRFF